jgi:anti-anti-sigma factor
MASFSIVRNDKKIRIMIKGDLTAPGVPELQAMLKQELADGIQEILFDFKDTSILDSSGIGLLVAACNSLSRVKGTMRVINVSHDLMQLLQSMRLVKRLNVSSRE